MSDYLAHSGTEKCPEGQKLQDHLLNVAALAAEFSKPFGEEDGYLCGLYHDIGKYSAAFQRRLADSRERVDHSSAGALLMFDHKNFPAAMCIAGHHTGLSDFGTKNDLSETFMARINHARSGEIEDCSAWKTEISGDIPQGFVTRAGIGNYFYIKMLFSALTDADWLDTEAFYDNRKVVMAENRIPDLDERLKSYISAWGSPKNEINVRRTHIRNAAVEHGNDMTGLFTMTVPTGGGKTISSMAFALAHAMKHNMRRVIYVIPYCSILEQTQDVFEGIFGKDAITAHYSGAEFERPEKTDDNKAFSSENWDAPIILTTAVQFFESLFSNKPGKNRKLHNIAGSVIVFDEAQMLPVPFMKPCLAAICQLVENYGCSAVLCTATQPAVERLLKEYLPNVSLRELCPEPEKIYQEFRRVTYVMEGKLSDEELVEQLRKRSQVLCVVNSRRQAQKLYFALKENEGCFHLSTMMTPYDRKRVLNEVRERLQRGEPCRVISTSLIEAGVDVDFPEVYRALAGLDSIIQSGGRCNREGKRPQTESLLHIFDTDTEPPRILEQNISAALRTLRRNREADSLDAIREYYQFLLYTLKDGKELDEKEIISCAEKLKFNTIAESFQMIGGPECVVYIPTGGGEKIIREIKQFGPNRKRMRELGKYSVSVYQHCFRELCEIGALEMIADRSGILCNPDLYSSETGLPFDVSEHNQAIFV